MGKREEEQSAWILQSGKAVLFGGVIAFIIGILFLFAVSFGISEGWLDTEGEYGLCVLACVLGSFLGGLVAVRKSIGRRLPIGVAVGLVMFLLELTGGILFLEMFSLENGAVGLLGGSLCGGAAAGILSGGKRHSKGKRRSVKRR